MKRAAVLSRIVLALVVVIARLGLVRKNRTGINPGQFKLRNAKLLVTGFVQAREQYSSKHTR